MLVFVESLQIAKFLIFRAGKYLVRTCCEERYVSLFLCVAVNSLSEKKTLLSILPNAVETGCELLHIK